MGYPALKRESLAPAARRARNCERLVENAEQDLMAIILGGRKRRCPAKNQVQEG